MGMDGVSDAERLESVKVGLVGAIATGLAFLLTTWLNQFIPIPLDPMVGAIQGLYLPDLVLPGALAGVSGGLFGITYRYVIRQDANDQLKTGAVFAFGGVRGLALVEGGLRHGVPLWSIGIPLLEAVLWFAIAALWIELGLGRGWLKPWAGEPVPLDAPPHEGEGKQPPGT
jgi:hypothetical protein